MRVIDRRRGLPVALGILYLHAATAQGWDAAGVNFPGHFLLRLDAAGKRVLIDPFDGGRTLDAAELRRLLKRAVGEEAELRPLHMAGMTTRDVLLRLLNNLKGRALKAGDIERSAAVLRRMTLIAPRHALSWAELGWIEWKVGNARRAIAALESYLALDADGKGHRHAAELIQRIKRQLN